MTTTEKEEEEEGPVGPSANEIPDVLKIRSPKKSFWCSVPKLPIFCGAVFFFVSVVMTSLRCRAHDPQHVAMVAVTQTDAHRHGSRWCRRPTAVVKK